MVFENDQLVEGGLKGEMSNEITYSEVIIHIIIVIKN